MKALTFRGRRHGLATLELVLFLPFYSLFVAALFVITAVSLNSSQTEMKNRAAAWRYRAEPWLAAEKESLDTRPAGEDMKIMGGRFRVQPHLAVYEEREQAGVRSGIGVNGPAAHAEHWIVTGSWDFRELPFPNQSEHPWLSAMDKIRFFFPSYRLNSFRVLGGR